MRSNLRSVFVLSALWLMVFSISSQMLIISPILPQIAETLGISPTLQGSLIAGYALPLGFFAFIVGPLSDRIGRRKILLSGTGAMVVALFLHSLVYNYTSLLIIRAIAGAAGGILSGSSIAFVGDAFTHKKRAWANGVVMTGIAGGFVFGIPIGTALAQWGHFSYPFLLYALSMLVAFVLIYLFVPQPNVERGYAPLTLNRMIHNYATLLIRPELLMLALSFALMSFCVALYVVFLPTWLKDSFGLNGYDIAKIIFFAGLSSAIVSPIAGRLSDKWGRKVFIVNACLGLSIAIAMTTIFVTDAWLAYPLVALAMMLDAARIGPFQALVTDLVPENRRGTMMSLSVTLGQMGMGFGSTIAGFLYENFNFVYNTSLAALAILSVGILVCWGISEPTYNDSPEGEELQPGKAKPVLFEKLPGDNVLVWHKKQ